MSEYVKFRLSAAKVGVSMALAALIGGIAEVARSGQATTHAAPSALFIKLNGISGATRTALLKLEYKWLKLDNLLIKTDHKLTRSYYDKRGVDASFLKITDANANFLKITDANTNFLKIGDANAKFLKIDGTAANADKLGGMTPGAFLQGRGNVMTNELVTNSTQQTLLGDGSVRILIGLDQAGQPSVTLENDTSSSLNFTVIGASTRTNTIAPNGGQVSMTPSQSQLDFQIFAAGGGGGAGKLWTATLSLVSGQAGDTFVGQMLIGLL